MSKTSSPTSANPAPLLAAAALVAVAALALAGWLVYGADIYLALVDGVLAWCM